jgi:hypothetical protein
MVTSEADKRIIEENQRGVASRSYATAGFLAAPIAHLKSGLDRG